MINRSEKKIEKEREKRKKMTFFVVVKDQQVRHKLNDKVQEQRAGINIRMPEPNGKNTPIDCGKSALHGNNHNPRSLRK